jgi:hypothetical protein
MPPRVAVEREVPVDDIDRDWDSFPRERIDAARIDEFVDLYANGTSKLASLPGQGRKWPADCAAM